MKDTTDKMYFLVFNQNYPSITEGKYYPIIDIYKDFNTQEVNLFFMADDGMTTMVKENDKSIDFQVIIESFADRVVK